MNRSLLHRLWGLRKPRRLSSVLLRRLRLSRFFTLESSGVRMKFFPAVWPALLWEQPDFFVRDTELLRRWLRPGDVMIDCGANVGLLTLVGAAAVGPNGVVYSIEAHPTIFGYLRQNVALNDARNVRLIHAAMGEREGTASFSDRAADDGNHIVGAGEGIDVPMRTLAAIVPEGMHVRLLKLDVEGYEKFVVEGAGGVLRECACIYFESSDELFGRYGYRCRDLFGMLEREGFVLFRYAGERQLERLPSGYQSVHIENLLAVQDPAELGPATGYTVRANQLP